MPGSANTRVALRLAVVVAVMASLSFAAVPFYSWFCRVTGYGGTPSVAAAAPGEVADRFVTVWFDANTDPAMPWQFRPLQREMTVRLGETGLAFYEAYNPTDRPIAGRRPTMWHRTRPEDTSTRSPVSVSTCRCWGPGERLEMPVTFFVDPEMLRDGDASRIRSITLSYTMFQTDPPPAEQSGTVPVPAAATAEAGDRRVTTIEQ